MNAPSAPHTNIAAVAAVAAASAGTAPAPDENGRPLSSAAGRPPHPDATDAVPPCTDESTALPAHHPSQSERLAVRGDRLAIVLYRFLQARPTDDLVHVLNAVVGRCGALSSVSRSEHPVPPAQGEPPTAQEERVAVARMSLEAASAALGRFPSRREYDRWRAAQPNPKEYAASSFIRRCFRDSWTEAIGQLGAPTADVSARRLLRCGLAFTKEERDRALRLFLDAVPAGQRTQSAYQAWALAYVRQPGAYDVPTKAQTLTRRAGRSWRELLADAGEREDRFRPVRASNGVLRCRFVTREVMLDRIHQAARELAVPAPTTTEFNRWAAQALDSAGRPISPKADTIIKRFGYWSTALFEAGLIDEKQLATYWHRHEIRMRDERMLQFVAAAVRDLGPDMGRLAYRRWRWRVLRHPDWAGYRIPADQTICLRYDGDWSAAVADAADIEPAREVPAVLHKTATAVWTKAGSKMERGRP